MTSKGVEALIQKDAATYNDYFNSIVGLKWQQLKNLLPILSQTTTRLQFKRWRLLSLSRNR